MQFIQKYITSISLVGLFTAIVGGYFILQSDTSSTSDGVKLSTGSTTISQSGIETDTVKRLETVANSLTGWGMSPFGSGKPLEEGEKKLEFKKPNTEWKTRTLSGITYVFGEGNPASVLEKLETFQGWDQNGYIDSNTVRPKVEILLAQFLENPTLIIVINKCGWLTTPGNTSSSLAMGLPGVIFTTDFSMESLITINPSTGRKELDMEKWGLLEWVFGQIREYGYRDIHTRVNLLASQCLNSDEIVSMDNLYNQYLAIQNSWYNGSSENRKEVCEFLELKECNPVFDQ
jgi:hypothetical protein